MKIDCRYLARFCVLPMIFCVSPKANAHEFWMTPDEFAPPVHTEVALSLFVGEKFQGDPVGFGRPMAASLRWYSLRGEAELRPNLPDNLGQSSIAMAFDRPGTQLIALDTQPFTLELPAEKFTDYLLEEGLEHVVAHRMANGQSVLPGRERYRRHVKTLIHVGSKSDASFRSRTGQTLEMIPLVNPHLLKAGRPLPLAILFQGVPVPGALVKAWSQQGPQPMVQATRTDAAGRVVVSLPWGGVWMLSVVHMVPNTDGRGQDWDSHWSNLTFEVPSGTQVEQGKR